MYSTKKKGDKQKQNKKTKYKAKKKNSKNLKKKPLLDEACWCCSEFLHLHKKVRREYQLKRQTSKA